MEQVIITFEDGHTLGAFVDRGHFANAEVQRGCKAAHIVSVKVIPPVEVTKPVIFIF